MSEQLYWRSGYTDEEGFMRCSCGCRGFTVEQHAERVRVTEAGDPVTVEGRAVYRCGSCEKAVIPLQNFDHLGDHPGPEASPPSAPPLAEELLDSVATEGGGG